jgi:predicted lipoprotein
LRTALESEAELLAKAVEALRSVKQLLASDLATALGVTISFSDMDGD